MDGHPSQSRAKPRTLLGRVAVLVLSRPRATWGVVLLCTLLSLGLASQLVVDPSMLSMLPEDHPTTMAIERLNAEEGGSNFVTLGFTGEEGEARDAALADLSRQIEQLEGPCGTRLSSWKDHVGPD